jgi:hypothetical protein
MNSTKVSATNSRTKHDIASILQSRKATRGEKAANETTTFNEKGPMNNELNATKVETKTFDNGVDKSSKDDDDDVDLTSHSDKTALIDETKRTATSSSGPATAEGKAETKTPASDSENEYWSESGSGSTYTDDDEYTTVTEDEDSSLVVEVSPKAGTRAQLLFERARLFRQQKRQLSSHDNARASSDHQTKARSPAARNIDDARHSEVEERINFSRKFFRKKK